MLLGAACAAIQRFEVRDTERMLMAAGFHMRLADTPEPQEDLRSISPYRIVSRTKDGNVVYLYADPDNCHCVSRSASRGGGWHFPSGTLLPAQRVSTRSARPSRAAT